MILDKIKKEEEQKNSGMTCVFTPAFFERELAKLNGGKKNIGIIAKDGFVIGSVFDDKTIEINNKQFAGPAEYETALQVLKDNGFVVCFMDQIKGKRVGFGTAWMSGK